MVMVVLFFFMMVVVFFVTVDIFVTIARIEQRKWHVPRHSNDPHLAYMCIHRMALTGLDRRREGDGVS